MSEIDPESDDLVVMCMRFESDSDAVVLGSMHDERCAKCGHYIWVSPSTGRARVLQPNILLFCVPCAMAKAEGEENAEVHVFPGVERELMDYYEKKKRGGL